MMGTKVLYWGERFKVILRLNTLMIGLDASEFGQLNVYFLVFIFVWSAEKAEVGDAGS